LPGIDEQLTQQVVAYVQKLRTLGLRKTPGVAESIDWANALMAVGVNDLHSEPVLTESTHACLIKTRNDLQLLKQEHAALYEQIEDQATQTES